MSSGVEKLSAEALGSAFPEAFSQLERYVHILSTRGLEWGLMGPREGDKLWSRHVSNSLALVDLLPGGVDLADIGSDQAAPIDVNGEATLDGTGLYDLHLRLRARQGAEPQATNLLGLIGRPDNQGIYHIRQRGQLR